MKKQYEEALMYFYSLFCSNKKEFSDDEIILIISYTTDKKLIRSYMHNKVYNHIQKNIYNFNDTFSNEEDLNKIITSEYKQYLNVYNIIDELLELEPIKLYELFELNGYYKYMDSISLENTWFFQYTFRIEDLKYRKKKKDHYFTLNFKK